MIIKPFFRSGSTRSGYLQDILNIHKATLEKVGVNTKLQANYQNKHIKKFLNILQLIKEAPTKEISFDDFKSLYNLFVVKKIYRDELEIQCNLEKNNYEYIGFSSDDFKLLDKYSILNLDNVLFKKEDSVIVTDYISFHDLSSGEKSIIYTLLGISSVIEDDCLICIDEPEISLHPEWQEEIITKLQEAFYFRKGCHFIIATHSPQVVSGLKSVSGFILDLENRELHCSAEYSFKSADHQLAKVFNAPGHNNEYLIRIALVIISKLAKQKTLDEKDLENLKFLRKIKESLPTDDSVQFLIEQLISMDSI